MSGMYAWSRIDTPSPNNIYTVDHGCLVVLPFTVEPGSKKEIMVAHVANGIQDASLRCWVTHAIDPGGRTLGQTLPTRDWHPNRNTQEKVLVHDSAVSVDYNPAYTIALEPGDYLLNVLNLVNSRNGFMYVLTDLV